MKLIFAAVAISLLAGCDLANDCSENPNLPCYAEGAAGPGAGDAGGAGGGDPAGGNGGEGGTGGAPDPACLPNEVEPIAEGCGVFVETGATGDGSKSDPVGTMAAALTALNGQKRIYICGGDIFAGSFSLPSGVSIYGRFTCDWQYDTLNLRPTIFGDPNVPTITIDGGTATLQGIDITADDASGFNATSLQGNASIGLLVNDANITLEDVTVTSGDGAPGENGVGQTGQADGRQTAGLQDDFDGNPGGPCGAVVAAPQQVYSCDGDNTTGGLGGLGQPDFGLGGGPGFPSYLGPEPNGSAGLGDDGTGAANTWSCVSDLGNGEFGEDGPPATAGPAGLGDGLLSTAGFVGAPGGIGQKGPRGQGGGGGGGRRGNSTNGCGAGQAGPGGGGGGAGGCGGLPGAGGGSGGPSFGIVSVDTTWTFGGVSVIAGAGGEGGDGGNSQLGGLGGVGGNSMGNACSGGTGGAGATGGSGGGGRGGHSVGVAWVGTDPKLNDDAVSVAGSAAPGGDGGNADVDGNGGADGLTEKSFDFEP